MAPAFIPIKAGFPPPNFPTAYADGVVNFSPGSDVVRFYLMRWDGNFDAKQNEYSASIFGQVVMPKEAFLHTVAFFEESLKYMVKLGHFTEEQIAKARAAAAEGPQPPIP
jgi:hypothetical protein